MFGGWAPLALRCWRRWARRRWMLWWWRWRLQRVVGLRRGGFEGGPRSFYFFVGRGGCFSWWRRFGFWPWRRRWRRRQPAQGLAEVLAHTICMQWALLAIAPRKRNMCARIHEQQNYNTNLVPLQPATFRKLFKSSIFKIRFPKHRFPKYRFSEIRFSKFRISKVSISKVRFSEFRFPRIRFSKIRFF